ncbi:MAG: hypothetical protein ACKVU4_15125 [Phycisphaerales bacterium]
MSSIEPIPFHVAQAYAVNTASRPARVAVAPAGRAGGAEPARMPARVDRLVAAVVPGRVDFYAGEPVPSASAIPMYRHPADKNAAAVSVHAGRVLDVRG